MYLTQQTKLLKELYFCGLVNGVALWNVKCLELDIKEIFLILTSSFVIFVVADSATADLVQIQRYQNLTLYEKCHFNLDFVCIIIPKKAKNTLYKWVFLRVKMSVSKISFHRPLWYFRTTKIYRNEFNHISYCCIWCWLQMSA